MWFKRPAASGSGAFIVGSLYFESNRDTFVTLGPDERSGGGLC